MGQEEQTTPSGDHELWEVWVNQPFHLSGEAEQYLVGVFTSCEAARSTCRGLMDEYLQSQAASLDGAERLWATWQESGPEPWVKPLRGSRLGGSPCPFRAADYARLRCAELFGAAGDAGPAKGRRRD